MAKNLVIKRADGSPDRPEEIYLDGNKIEDVISYELKEDSYAQLTLTIFIEDVEVQMGRRVQHPAFAPRDFLFKKKDFAQGLLAGVWLGISLASIIYAICYLLIVCP